MSPETHDLLLRRFAASRPPDVATFKNVPRGFTFQLPRDYYARQISGDGTRRAWLICAGLRERRVLPRDLYDAERAWLRAWGRFRRDYATWLREASAPGRQERRRQQKREQRKRETMAIPRGKR